MVPDAVGKMSLSGSHSGSIIFLVVPMVGHSWGACSRSAACTSLDLAFGPESHISQDITQGGCMGLYQGSTDRSYC